MIQSIFVVRVILKMMVLKTIKTISANDSNILSWKSKGLTDESIETPSTSNKMLNPSVNNVDVGTKARTEFKGDYLKQKKLHLIMEK